MFIDFAIIDTDINETEAKDTIKYIIDNNLASSITVPYFFGKTIKQFTNSKQISASCFIDFPLGISDLNSRILLAKNAINYGFNAIDICMPQNLAANRKYTKIRDDVQAFIDIKNEKNIDIRYILEYRKFDHYCLKKICEIFDVMGIQYVFPSTGYFIDNLADNILASIFLYQNSKDIKVISTGNAWQNKHFETLIKSGLFGLRTTSIHTLNNFLKFNLEHQKK
jgi:deoxyribose-phosphate aldolase